MSILITVGAQQFAAGTTALTGRGLSSDDGIMIKLCTSIEQEGWLRMGEIYRGHNADFRVNLADRIVLVISHNFYSIRRESTLTLSVQRRGVRGEDLLHGKFLPNQFLFV